MRFRHHFVGLRALPKTQNQTYVVLKKLNCCPETHTPFWLYLDEKSMFCPYLFFTSKLRSYRLHTVNWTEYEIFRILWQGEWKWKLKKSMKKHWKIQKENFSNKIFLKSKKWISRKTVQNGWETLYKPIEHDKTTWYMFF